MKNKSAAQDSNSNGSNGSNYWMSLEQLGGDPALAARMENEFLSSPLSSEDGKDGFARRDFLKVMGASFALATAGCIRRPQEHIIPYAKAPKEITPGEPNFYTSTWFDGYEGAGLLVKTMEGRPIKVEGNPLHPMTRGGLSAKAHAEILALYDPDRLRGPVQNLPNEARTNKESVSTTFEEADEKIVAKLKEGGIAIVSGTHPSPSTKAIIADFGKAFGSARWVQYDPLSVEAIRLGQKASYGRAILPRYRFNAANMIVSIDSDFLGTLISPVEFAKDWSKRRTPNGDMARFVAFESFLSTTGMSADDRFRIRASQQLDVVLALIARVAKLGKGSIVVPSGIAASAKLFEDAPKAMGLDEALFEKVASQLVANRGASLIVAGGLPTLTVAQVELQIAVNALNSMLGNDGKTIDHESATFETMNGSAEALQSLIADMAAGKVKTLVIDELNLNYVLPKDSGFSEAIKKVGTVIYTGNRNDETGAFSHWVLPAGSSLESWGDFELQSGIYSIQQPTIMPMYQTRSFGESLLVWTQKGAASARAKASATWRDYVMAVWKSEIQPKVEMGRGKSFDDFWLEVLQTGVAANAGRRERTGAGRAFVGQLSVKPSAVEGYELVLYPSVQLGDGRRANVAWLQELPDPVSKVVWDNYLQVSPAMARKEGLAKGDIVEITIGDLTVKAPVLVQPGVHDSVVALAVGYGQKQVGKVGAEIGVNAYPLSTFAAGKPVFSGRPVKITKTSGRYEIVSTQDHHVMEGRAIVIEATKDAFEKDPSSGIHKHQVFSIWPQHQYTKHKWGMAIDLNSCTGCSSCVIACQAENNIQTVGKKYVMQGREMHWIRIDRYYKGSMDNPEVAVMPLACQHCENAPCETVCPVLATVHNDEGLNDMVYNRCVGTRYCSNNCPYKVRRFNWFNFMKKREEPLHMAYNPDVTVRPRGVMEKCTFCVQRIRKGTNKARDEKRLLKDGDITPACADSCPTNAITFGDLNDSESRVAKLFKDKRSYKLLEELNAAPRVAYQTRIRNAERAPVLGHGEHAPEDGPAAAPHKEEKHSLNTNQQHEGELV
jgi:MoCo/4Fe-4S cofactor protein with predicted Tat translocation signal